MDTGLERTRQEGNALELCRDGSCSSLFLLTGSHGDDVFSTSRAPGDFHRNAGAAATDFPSADQDSSNEHVPMRFLVEGRGEESQDTDIRLTSVSAHINMESVFQPTLHVDSITTRFLGEVSSCLGGHVTGTAEGEDFKQSDHGLGLTAVCPAVAVQSFTLGTIHGTVCPENPITRKDEDLAAAVGEAEGFALAVSETSIQTTTVLHSNRRKASMWRHARVFLCQLLAPGGLSSHWRRALRV